MFTESSQDVKAFINGKEVPNVLCNMDDIMYSLNNLRNKRKIKTKTYLKNNCIVVKRINRFYEKETILSISFVSRKIARHYYSNKSIKGRINGKRVKCSVTQYLMKYEGKYIIDFLGDHKLITGLMRGSLGGRFK